MHFPAILAGLAAFSTTVTAAPAEKPHHSPLNVPLGVLTHQKNNKLTELEFVNVYSIVKGVEPPKMDQIRCQMYKDQYGTVPITKDLTTENGVVSKKPIYLGWVLCRVKAQK
ncbi:uncharacterized protein FSUBG_8963 [Fusarium subglutinans]|uniref:Uncharacterized protein n=1 Tax=Gibberella subglutinans TaxID=42677 RepID=A0A8H5PGD6_GIBSU|nr:uncharacterized protein FSUBG_8963 [Fusarium subglutinans]KAF5596053.1 hypothetical protein FSUBG_8963 [Fusarium subglutinans]